MVNWCNVKLPVLRDKMRLGNVSASFLQNATNFTAFSSAIMLVQISVDDPSAAYFQDSL